MMFLERHIRFEGAVSLATHYKRLFRGVKEGQEVLRWFKVERYRCRHSKGSPCAYADVVWWKEHILAFILLNVYCFTF
jgi:hypothetical protein